MPLQVAAVLSLAMKCLVVMYVERIQQFRRDFSVCVIPIIIITIIIIPFSKFTRFLKIGMLKQRPKNKKPILVLLECRVARPLQSLHIHRSMRKCVCVYQSQHFSDQSSTSAGVTYLREVWANRAKKQDFRRIVRARRSLSRVRVPCALNIRD